jgi:hypothetical protein
MRTRHHHRHLMADIRQILLHDWNPIGFLVPADEYDSYIPTLLRLLTRGADRHRLTEHLYALETICLALPGDRPRCARVADRLLESKRRPRPRATDPRASGNPAEP